MTTPPPGPREFLPLKTAWFHILLALGDGPAHGYAVRSEVEERTAGRVKLWPATLYGSIRDMEEDVAALVSHLDAESVTVELVNTSPLHERRLIAQAGAFGEHHFRTAQVDDGSPHDINDSHLRVTLPPGRSIKLTLGMDRYVHTPSYTQPV